MNITVTAPGLGDGIAIPDLKGLEEDLVEQLFLRIQARTPVDTGNARDGWNIDGLNIINMVPYIVYLENGWSKQAPAGMIRVSLEEVPQIIQKYIATNKPKQP